MLRIGIAGLGFMGKGHFAEFTGPLAEMAKVVAIADVDPAKRAGDWSGIGGNIGAGQARADLAGIRLHEDYAALANDPDIDVIDITLPTYLHAPAAAAALEAGKHVICEKPMAIQSAEARRMAETARKAGRLLFVAQCIRFWPAYAHAAEMVRSGQYGPVRAARFHRFSARPAWSWQNWLMDNAKSGMAALDFHIHDADYIAGLFGMPRAVTSHGSGPGIGPGAAPGGGLDHILTTYHYPDGKLVVAEGAWEHAPGYPFSMTFTMHMDGGTLVFAPDASLTFYPAAGGARPQALSPSMGYEIELRHFLECIRAGRESEIIRPEGAADSVALVEAEIQSAKSGKTVII